MASRCHGRTSSFAHSRGARNSDGRPTRRSSRSTAPTNAASGMMPYISFTSQRPKFYQQPYALPGDTVVPKPAFHIIDVASKTNLGDRPLTATEPALHRRVGARLGVERRLRSRARHVFHARIEERISRRGRREHRCGADHRARHVQDVRRDRAVHERSHELVRDERWQRRFLVVGARRLGASLPDGRRGDGAGRDGRRRRFARRRSSRR